MLEGQHYQNAYITRDIEKAIEAFRTRGAVKKALRFEGPVDSSEKPGPGLARVAAAIRNGNGVAAARHIRDFGDLLIASLIERMPDRTL